VPEVRVAIVGYGLAGRVFHAPLIAATDGVEVGQIVTSNPMRARQAGAEHPEAQVVPSVEDLWAATPPDLVVVATANSSHFPMATAVIEQGVPVVVEKPMAVTAAEAEALVERADRSSVLLTVFQNRRWDTDQLTLRRLIEEGALGEVTRYESRFERWRPSLDPTKPRENLPPEEGGGVLLDLGVHLVDQALALFGSVADVYAEIDSRRGRPPRTMCSSRCAMRAVPSAICMPPLSRPRSGRVCACRERPVGSWSPTWIHRRRHCAPGPGRTPSITGVGRRDRITVG
jgi:predicted dehydrogenase